MPQRGAAGLRYRPHAGVPAVSHQDGSPWNPDDLTAVQRFDWEKIILRLRVPSHLRAAKVVALTLATYADAKNGRNVRPGEKRLMAQCQLSERTVRECLRYLRDMVLIYRNSRGSNIGKTNYTDVYQLSAPKQWRDVLDLLPEDS